MRFSSSIVKALGLAAVAFFSAPAQTFAVASIKPRDVSRPTVQYRVGPDSFASPGTLKFLISQAYEVGEYQVVGGPPWIGSAAFDLLAKADHAVPPKENPADAASPSGRSFRVKVSSRDANDAGLRAEHR